jgi:hypothetical protein
MIDQFAEMYPYDRERMLNKKTEEMEAVERARRESEQMAAQMAALPPPHDITQEQPQAPPPQPPVHQEQPQAPPPQPPVHQAPPPPQPQPPVHQAPPPQEPKQQPKEDTFRPTMMQMLDKDRLKREAVLLQHEQRAFRMRIFRGVLIAIAVGSLVLYFTKRK